MQRDFHYYCIKVLACKAGFMEEAAEIIAYASQYVDDATDSKDFRITNLDHEELKDLKKYLKKFNLLKNDNFNPVCTAHKEINFANEDAVAILMQNDGDFKKIQNKVYIPFHFLPTNLIDSNNADFCCKGIQNNAIINDLVDFKSDSELNVDRLIRLGILLHIYADTFSHEGFSGRYSQKDNDVEDIYYCDKKGKYRKTGEVAYGLAPDIGHAEVGFLPDVSHLVWCYKKNSNLKDIIFRNNIKTYLNGAKAIFYLLCSTTKSGNEQIWPELEKQIRPCFEYEGEYSLWEIIKENFDFFIDNTDEKCKNWKKNFPSEITKDYKENQWFDDAIYNQRRCDIYAQTDKNKWMWFRFHAQANDIRAKITLNILSDNKYN